MKVTAEDVAQLLASAPPRLVPAHVARAVLGGRAMWFLPVFGLVFGGMGLLFTAIFFPWRFLDEWRLAADSAQTAPGVITEVTKTNMSINEQSVWGYGFTFTLADGRRIEGRCYTTGDRWTAGTRRPVRYLPARPEVACLEGARLSQGSGGSTFVIIFPLIGGGLVYWFVVDRRRKRRLLSDGLVTEVDVISVDETSAKVNYQPVYKIVIAGSALQGGQPVTLKRVNKPDVHLALRHALQKQPVFVLYDPRNHTRVIFPEALIEGGA